MRLHTAEKENFTDSRMAFWAGEGETVKYLRGKGWECERLIYSTADHQKGGYHFMNSSRRAILKNLTHLLRIQFNCREKWRGRFFSLTLGSPSIGGMPSTVKTSTPIILYVSKELVATGSKSRGPSPGNTRGHKLFEKKKPETTTPNEKLLLLH